MSTLWIFGDSYGVHVEQDASLVNKWFWGYEVAKRLRCEFYNNQSQMGVSNEYIQYRIMQDEKNISSSDYVIVISTSIFRKWFFKENPWMSNFYVDNIHEHFNKNQIDALTYYTKYLHNPEMDIINLHRFLGWLHYIGDKRKWNMLVLPGFESDGYPISHQYDVEGSLYDVCYGEFATMQDSEWYYKNYCEGRDKRSGHLLKSNHAILADKIYDTFTNKSRLSLSDGFVKGVISEKNISAIQDQLPEIYAKNGTIKGIRFNNVI